jgi:hypothetical protein
VPCRYLGNCPNLGTVAVNARCEEYLEALNFQHLDGSSATSNWYGDCHNIAYEVELDTGETGNGNDVYATEWRSSRRQDGFAIQLFRPSLRQGYMPVLFHVSNAEAFKRVICRFGELTKKEREGIC